ncbi:MAG: histidine kinase [Propioniciclava sp.]|uniref:sensor histidine kinase n=1 Tax=Propioniciclava sp. TaxID=2038686 RepID=UPI0039E3FF64
MNFFRRRPIDPEQDAARQIAALTASRRVIVDAYEVERRRIERDLHDGTQQYLVAALMKLGEARMAPSVAADPWLGRLLAEAQDALGRGLDSLRATVRGIHPQVLVEQGLEAALADVAQGAASPVRIVCPHPLPSLPEGVLATGYFFACEAIANATKYAPGAPITVLLATDTHLRVSVVDAGPGGARLVPGHGLAGMRERLAAFGGDVTISSPAGGPTQVVATVPLLLHRGEPGVVV